MEISFRKNVFLALLVIILLTTLHYIGALTPLERLWQNSIAALAVPVNKSMHAVIFWSGWKEKESLEKEILLLTESIQKNQSRLATFSSLQKENTELRQAIGWRDTLEDHYLIGKIIGKPLNLPDTFSLINRGSLDGVAIGDAVIINKNILVGKITAVEHEIATLRFITDNNSVFSVRRPSSADPMGRVVGRLGLTLGLDTVPATEELIEGDIIVTSGLDEHIPSGLVIGSIESIIRDPNDFFQSATINTPYSSKNISVVSIITG